MASAPLEAPAVAVSTWSILLWADFFFALRLFCLLGCFFLPLSPMAALLPSADSAIPKLLPS
jgi:hypothetical protein